MLRAGAAVAIVALAVPAVADEPAAVGGVYEMGIEVTDPIPQIHYWQQFGFRIGREGSPPAEASQPLYGVDSKLRSIPLYHQDDILNHAEDAQATGMPICIFGERSSSFVAPDGYFWTLIEAR
jgi:hypothetical protein